jgi:GMP synthase (glutamine-hydrolysing)
MKRYLLLQARNPTDIVRPEEHKAFAEQLNTTIDFVDTCDVLSDELSVAKAQEYDAVLVGGAGEYSVLDDDIRIKGFIEHLGELTTQNVPMFASCFGFQALVLALGGTVIKDVPNAEVGTYTLFPTPEAEHDPVFCALPSPFLAQMGHQDRAERLPDSIVNFAYSDRAPFQAFRVADTSVYATQFHPELTYDENRKRFARYIKIYGALFGEVEAQNRMDSHRPSPESNSLLSRFSSHVLS